MRNIYIAILIIFSAILVAQDNSNKRKVYRTQTGAIIQAPKPIFEIKQKKKNNKAKSDIERVQDKVKKDRFEAKYKAELENLESKLVEIIEENNNRIAEQNNNRTPDTVFVYTTQYDTTTVYDTTLIYTNATTTVYDTLIISDSLYITKYDTTVIRDTVWAFATDTVFMYDTSWVFAYDTTILKDSVWVFASDTTIIYDTLVVANNDTVTIHTYSSRFPDNFSPAMLNENFSAFPKFKTLADAIRARDTGDKTAQGWINQALNAAGGDWSQAEKEYAKLQEIYSTTVVKAITRGPKSTDFIGPDMQYKSVVFDTLKILTFDTTLVQDTVKNLVKQTFINYDTTIIDDRQDVIAHTTPPGHELMITYHNNGEIKVKGLMKDNKRNGEWMYYDKKGIPLRKTIYDMGKLIDDQLIVLGEEKKKEEEIQSPPPKPKKKKGFFGF